MADGMVDRVRVLHLLKGMGAGGAEHLVVAAARVRDRTRFDYEAAFLLPSKAVLVPRLEAEEVEVHCLDAPNVLDLTWLLRLRRLVRDRRVDVVHVHSPLPGALARPMLRLRSTTAIVTTEHNVWSSYDRWTRVANSGTFGLADRRIAVSEEVRNSVRPRHRAGLEVVVHGLELEAAIAALRHRATVRTELGLADGDVAVITVANLRRQKGYHDLLLAARQVVDDHPDARFFSVGQGPLAEEVRARCAELGLGDQFTFLGYRRDPLRLLAGCDIFAMASHYEGYPLAVMEAMAVGLPVVATTVGGVPQAIEDGVDGLLVPRRDPAALAQAIGGLVGAPERRRRMGAVARERAARYDIRTAVRRTEQIYLEAIAARS